MSKHVMSGLIIACTLVTLAVSRCGDARGSFEEQLHQTNATLAKGGDRQRWVALQSWAKYCISSKQVHQLFEIEPGAEHKWFHDCEWIEIHGVHWDLYLWRQGEDAGASYVRPDVTEHVYVPEPED